MARKGIRKAAVSTGIGVALALGATMGIAAPASAAKCDPGYLCTWKDSYFLTDGSYDAMIRFSQYIPNYGTWNYEGTVHGGANSATSIYNNGVSETAVMYAGSYKTSKLFEIPKGNSNASLVGGHGDNIESGYYWSHN